MTLLPQRKCAAIYCIPYPLIRKAYINILYAGNIPEVKNYKITPSGVSVWAMYVRIQCEAEVKHGVYDTRTGRQNIWMF